MKTVQMTLDEDLVTRLDKMVKKLGTTRSAFTREALQRALERVQEQAMERRHREGYRKHPVTKDEFSNWENEQDWGE